MSTKTRMCLESEGAERVRPARDARHFLTIVSHEMRTPLNAIVGLSRLLLDAENQSEENRRALKNIHQAGHVILALVNDILELSKLESGTFELHPAEYETSGQISETANMNLLLRREKDIRFTLVLDETLPEKMHGDELRIKQIFNNLLSNAFKYTRQGCVEWKISWERDRDGKSLWLVSSIRDSGIGIRPEDMETLFVDYGQLDGRANRHIEGTGLGLPLAKKLVELMDGRLSVESEYGKGSVFTVRIRQGFVDEKPIGAERAEALRNFRYDDRSAHDERMKFAPLPDARVLLVDDVPVNLDVARGMLKPYGMKVDALSGGAAAVEAVRAERVRYDMIFMDHMMPEMDGIEAMQRIRALGTEYARAVPIIVLTANALAGNEKKFLDAGFQGFLGKPIDARLLDVIVRRWAGGRATEISPPSPPPGLEGPDDLDMERARARFSGDERALRQVLRSYARHTPAMLRRMEALSPAGLADYAIDAHGLKGSSLGIGAGRIGDRAGELERAAKSGDFAFVAARNADFIASVERLIARLDETLAGFDARKPERETPDPQTLERLRAASGRRDMDGVDEALEALEAFRYASGQDLVAWLREQADRAEFRSIEGRLAVRAA